MGCKPPLGPPPLTQHTHITQRTHHDPHLLQHRVQVRFLQRGVPRRLRKELGEEGLAAARGGARGGGRLCSVGDGIAASEGNIERPLHTQTYTPIQHTHTSILITDNHTQPHPPTSSSSQKANAKASSFSHSGTSPAAGKYVARVSCSTAESPRWSAADPPSPPAAGCRRRRRCH